MPRLRIPTAKRVLDGNRSRRPLPANEPKPIEGLPEPPPEVSERPEALRYWYEVGRECVAMRVMTHADQFALADLCLMMAERDATMRALDGKRLKDSMRMRHMVNLRNLRRDIRLSEGEFGLTPVARTKVDVAKTQGVDDIELAIGELPPERKGLTVQ